MSQTKAQLISDLVQALNFTGTATAPANGLFLSAANTLKLATASTERLKIDGTELVVNDTGADVDFRVEGDSNTNLFKVDAGNDRIGVGTSSPTDLVDILNTTNNSRVLRLSHPSTPTAAAGFLGFNSDGSTNNNVVTLGVQYSSSYYNVLNLKRSTQAVGIGTVNPSTPFHVYHATTNGVATFESGDTDAVITLKDNAGQASVRAIGNALTLNTSSSISERMRIDSSGRMLIGITSARANFGNNTSGVAQKIQLEGTSSITSSMSLIRNSNDVNDGGIIVGKTRGTSVGSNTVVQAGDDLGNITFAGADGTSMLFGAEIKAKVESGVGNDDMPAALVFSTNSGTTSTTERMRIDSSGRVIVGSDTHIGGAQFVVMGGNINTYGAMAIGNKATNPGINTAVANFRFNSGATGTRRGAEMAVHTDGNWTDGSSHPSRMSFSTTATNETGSTERMRIDSSGRLLINGTDANAVHTNADDVIIGNTSASLMGLSIVTSTSGYATLQFSDGGGNKNQGQVAYNHSNNSMILTTNQESRLTINSDGNVLINTTATPTGYGNLNVFGTDNIGSRVSIRRGSANNDGPSIWFNKSRNTTDGSHTVVQANDNLGSILFTGNDSQGPEYAARIMCEVDGTPGSNDMPGRLVFSVTPDGSDSMSEAMRIHNSGKVAINTTNASGQLTVNGTSNAGHYVPGASGGIAQSGIHVGGNHGNSGERGGAISFSAGGAAACAIACRNESTDRDQIGLEFFTHNATDQAAAADRRLRMSTSGHMFFGSQDVLDNANNNSVGISLSDHLGFLSVSRDSDIPLVVGITGSDTQLIRFIAQGTIEGNISVSGSTVSYNGGHLSRWSQIKGLSTTDKSARPTIYQGTVMSNLDDLCVWSYPDQFYTEQDKTNGFIPGDKEVGDLRKAAHTEENQQLNMTKVSDTEGDKDVAGVFWTWDDTNDDYYVNDYYIAMTGDMVIRVAASTTVARGDLLISAGDGTAKPQADDIIRSSTIAKITSTNATATYDDGSKAYPCVLMAC